MATFPLFSEVVWKIEVWKELTMLGMKKCILMSLGGMVGMITNLVQGMRGSNVQKHD